jgi:hypothetical protein
VRIHVKTAVEINVIQETMSKIVGDKRLHIINVKLHYTSKNKTQKKGFIVYIKLKTRFEAPIVKNIVNEYPQLKGKVGIAHSYPNITTCDDHNHDRIKSNGEIYIIQNSPLVADESEKKN